MAIIAILVAIAVPNFLEAQTRSKVSRVKSDLRTLATGLEMYQIDWNGVPYDGQPNGAHYGWTTVYSKCTTPAAYMTNVTKDPFQDPAQQSDAQAYPGTSFLVDKKNHSYDYGTAYYHSVVGYVPFSETNYSVSSRWYARIGNSAWKAGSAGPDCSYDKNSGGYELGDAYDPPTARRRAVTFIVPRQSWNSRKLNIERLTPTLQSSAGSVFSLLLVEQLHPE